MLKQCCVCYFLLKCGFSTKNTSLMTPYFIEAAQYILEKRP